MSDRLPAHVEAGSLARRAESAGGTAMVLARGDRDAGAILVQLADRGLFRGFLERRAALDGPRRWHLDAGLVNESFGKIDEYITRRRRSDPDLWVIELDVVGVERFAAEIIATG